MWLFITSRIRTWLLIAVVLPIATSLIRLIRVRIEATRPDSNVVKAMKTVEGFGQRRRRESAAR